MARQSNNLPFYSLIANSYRKEQLDLAAESGEAAAPTQHMARLALLLGSFWLVFLAIPLFSAAKSDSSPQRLVLTLLGTGSFVAIYLWTIYDQVIHPTVNWRWGSVLALTALSLVLVLSNGEDWLGLFIYVEIIAGFVMLPGKPSPVVGGLVVLTVIVGWGMGGTISNAGMIAAAAGVAGITAMGAAQFVTVNRDLWEARRELARLAISEERLRFARDLHDLLGHSLSIITLKAELAERIFPVAPDRALTEIADLERVAREALREVREAVSGYRQPSLASELASAREILEASGIACQIEDAARVLPPATESVLGWAVREGITNLVRHSRAHQCRIRVTLSGDWIDLEMIDDGQSAVESSEQGGVSIGSGLAGLTERAAAIGGRCEAGALSGGGFRLHVKLPAGSEGITESSLSEELYK